MTYSLIAKNIKSRIDKLFFNNSADWELLKTPKNSEGGTEMKGCGGNAIWTLFLGILLIVAAIQAIVNGIEYVITNLPALILLVIFGILYTILLLLGLPFVLFGPIVIGVLVHTGLTRLLAKSNRIKDLKTRGHIFHVLIFLTISLVITAVWIFLIPHVGEQGSWTQVFFPWNLSIPGNTMGIIAWIEFVVLGAGWAWMIEWDTT